MAIIGYDEEERASCQCQNCTWTETDEGHLAVLEGGSHSAEHALATGHTVVEEKVITITMTGPQNAAA
jgi:hypothetical protein